MRTHSRYAAFVLAAISFLSLPAAAVEPTPRALADAASDAIAANYFDPEAGRRHADGLRQAAAAGRFDSATDTEAAAKLMTDFLRVHDRHFAVRRSGDRPRVGPGPSRKPMPSGGIERTDVLPGNVGYLALRGFADFRFGDSEEPARKAMDAALVRLAGADAMIVDLRDNGGGSPAMVGYLASAFLAPGADVFNTFRSPRGSISEAPREWHAHPRTKVPLYILVGPRTASAAESFAYTLKHAGRATVVGESTAGAANPGEPFDLGNGYSVFVSTGSPVNPKTGGNWEGVGVQPNVVVGAPEALDTALARIASAKR